MVLSIKKCKVNLNEKTNYCFLGRTENRAWPSVTSTATCEGPDIDTVVATVEAVGWFAEPNRAWSFFSLTQINDANMHCFGDSDELAF